MGTKRQLAPAVADTICAAQQGVVLDVFSGMCAIGAAIGERRQVWNNDVQIFASKVAEALFTSRDFPPLLSCTINILFKDFKRNVHSLEHEFNFHLNEEKEAIESNDLTRISNYLNKFAQQHLSNEAVKERSYLSDNPKTFPYKLFTTTYADGYWGLYQCIEIDSIVYAIDQALERGELTHQQRVWLVIALGRAIIRVSNTTGHFAQYLEPKESTLARYVSQRKKGVWESFIAGISEVSPIGTLAWRKRNRVFNSDGIGLLKDIRKAKDHPSVIYADPPYTEDQYSRYYHILETLIRYDYPQVSSKGRYRSDRYQTPFSLTAKVTTAFDSLVSSAAALGADLVVSYPNNGLLHKIGEVPERFLRRYYRTVEISHCIQHQHSTFGASKGVARALVTEIIYWARS